MATKESMSRIKVGLRLKIFPKPYPRQTSSNMVSFLNKRSIRRASYACGLSFSLLQHAD